jgi:hypothetical protein
MRRMDFSALPGGDLVMRGLADLRAGRRTVESLLVQIGAPRLRACGLDVPPREEPPERALYDMLAAEDEDSAHGRYNALVRRLVGFEQALECASR